MRPSLSVASTASPILASVEASTRRLLRHSAVIHTISRAIARNNPSRTPTARNPLAVRKKKYSSARAEATIATSPMVNP